MHRFLLSIILIIFLLPIISSGQDCQMTGVTATAFPCNGAYFMVSINLEVSNSSPGFTLAGNGTIYGTFQYADLPVIIGPFVGDDESVYSFIAWDVENPDCQQFTTLTANDCVPVCQFSNATLDSISCMNNGFALVELDFDHQGTTNPAFDVFYENGTEVGSWLYQSLPVTISSFAVSGAEPIVLTICDNFNPGCCETFTFPAIDCNPNNCEIYNVTIDPECTGNNFLVHFDFDINHPASDSFNLTGNTLNYGTFAYSELPLTLGPLNGGTNIVWEFNIVDTENLNCAETAVLGIYKCPPPCDISSLEATPTLCNGNDAYALLVSMEIEGEGDNGFSVFSETKYYGTYSYDDLPITLPAYLSECELAEQVTVCDNDELGCCATTVYEALLCCGCIIYNLHAVAQPCNDQNEIFVLLDFDFQNTSGTGFTVYGDGNQYGEFDYEDVPVLIGPFPGDGSQFLEFVVADIESQDCFDATEIGLLSCTDICDVSNLVVETGACTGSDEYVLTLDFDFENVSGNSFDVFINGDFYAPFSYADLPITLQDFPGSGNDLDEITVCDNDDADCCITLEFPAPDCQCSIFETSVIPIGCNSDSTFTVEVYFEYENLSGDFIDIFFEDELVGIGSVNDIPILVELPEGDGTGILKVCATDVNNCCQEVFVQQMLCEGPVCLISELTAQPGACTSDSTFVLDISFNSLNLPNDSVLIYANNSLIGQFYDDPNFIHIVDFPTFDGDLVHITVCADGVLGCCDDYSFESPDCDTTNCEIWDLAANPGDCLTDSSYTLVIEYNSENIPGDSVSITLNDDFIGIFIDTGGHIIIEQFPWTDGGVAVLTLCSVAFPDCCDSDQFIVPNCPDPDVCNIFDLVVNLEECQSDSTYLAALNFQYELLISDSVVVTANGVSLGTHHVNGGHILIDSVPVFLANNTVFTVCASDLPDCCESYEFTTPYCGTECLIDISSIETGVCLTDSTYSLQINFLSFNLPTDSVVIDANGVSFGQFHVNGGLVNIEQFPEFDEDLTELHVCAANAPDCCDVIIFATQNCGPECDLFDLVAEVDTCTSDTSFSLDISYEIGNIAYDSVTVYVSDLFIGQFASTPELIHIENFPSLGGDFTTITVCAVGYDDCCDTYTFEIPICGNCAISELTVDVGQLTTDSTFSAIIDFDFQNVSAGGFDVYAGLAYLGFFTFDQVPFSITNFPCNQTGDYVITVCQDDDLSCCAFLPFDGPVCQDVNCSIFDLDWDCAEGDSAGTFFFILNFSYQDVGIQGFNVVGNGNDYGNFNYEDLPIQIGPFVEDDTDYEFLVFDAQSSACFDLVSPGVVDCITATDIIQPDDVYQVYNNGVIPGILPLKPINLTLFNSNGKILLQHKSLLEGNLFELKSLPSGMYIGIVEYEGNRWPVKLVKNAY